MKKEPNLLLYQKDKHFVISSSNVGENDVAFDIKIDRNNEHKVFKK